MAMNGGFGSPTFFFYPPLPYYVSAPLPARCPPQQAIHPCQQQRHPGSCCSQGVCHLWLRATTPQAGPGGQPALSGAAYHVAMDLYARFALAEFWAFAWAAPYPAGGRISPTADDPGFAPADPQGWLLAFSHLPALAHDGAGHLARLLVAARRDPALLGALLDSPRRQGVGLCMAAALLLPALADQGPSPWS